MTQADRSLTKLVQKFAADGLEARDDADEAVGRSTRIVLLQIAVAIGIALGVGFVLGRDLSRPLGQLSRIIGRLAAGDLDLDVRPGCPRAAMKSGMSHAQPPCSARQCNRTPGLARNVSSSTRSPGPRGWRPYATPRTA